MKKISVVIMLMLFTSVLFGDLSRDFTDLTAMEKSLKVDQQKLTLLYVENYLKDDDKSQDLKHLLESTTKVYDFCAAARALVLMYSFAASGDYKYQASDVLSTYLKYCTNMSEITFENVSYSDSEVISKSRSIQKKVNTIIGLYKSIVAGL